MPFNQTAAKSSCYFVMSVRPYGTSGRFFFLLCVVGFVYRIQVWLKSAENWESFHEHDNILPFTSLVQEIMQSQRSRMNRSRTERNMAANRRNRMPDN